uniref:Uncharacterized protein n=1 Tax=Pristionchus pacificus TaxID=54126 RepID=A0A2A6B5Q8_PRIPA|eukprot:PDM61207.1 hypothetical protein PRIPAC_50649 [Pristionchus pacificus]
MIGRAITDAILLGKRPCGFYQSKNARKSERTQRTHLNAGNIDGQNRRGMIGFLSDLAGFKQIYVEEDPRGCLEGSTMTR